MPSFFKELDSLKEKGLETENRVFISDRGEFRNPAQLMLLTRVAHVDFDLFQAVDGLEEIELGKGAIGTTKKGEALTSLLKKPLII